MRQTAVEQLKSIFYDYANVTGLENDMWVIYENEFEAIIKRVKEMEIKQSHEYAEFAIRCDRKHMKILNFDGYMNLETSKSE